VLGEEMDGLARTLGRERFDAGRFAAAAKLFDRMSTSETLEEFLTLPAYELLIGREAG
jgi:malate synthase